MSSILSNFWSAIAAQVIPPSSEQTGKKEIGLLESIEQAHKEWQMASGFFEHVTDPDLIDMAIYSMDAAEKKYVYLLKIARKKGLRLDEPFRAERGKMTH